jgi:peptide/nickel transport system substrate-binding protein
MRFSITPLTRSLMVVTCLSTAALTSAPVMAATPKDTLVVALALDDVIGFDPHEQFEITSAEIFGNTYNQLVRFDPADPSTIFGDLAKSWTVSADGKTFTFELKPGLKFASGNPITADDAVWSLQRALLLDKAPAFILTQLGLNKNNAKDRIKQAGPLTLTLETDKTYATSLVLNCLTSTIGTIVDKQLVMSKEVNGDMGNAWLKTNYAGSGAMKIREWRANEAIVLDRNENFFGDKSKLNRIIYRHVKESATQRLMLEKEDVDIARNLTPQDLTALGANKDINLTQQRKGSLMYISMNMKNPIFAKPEVREAMKWLIDYQAINDTLIKGIGSPHQNFLAQGMLGASITSPFKLDVNKAKALLTKAGYPNGFKVSFDVRSTQPVMGIAEAVQQSAAKAGVQIEIIPGDGKQTLTKYRARQHDMYIGQWGADYWDPDTNTTFVSNNDNSDEAKLKPLAWRNYWHVPEMTKKAEAAKLETNTAKRKKMYEELQDDFRASSPFAMMYQVIENAAFRNNLDGLKLGPTADTNYMYRVSKR